MLTIRRAQMEAMARAISGSFLELAVSHIRRSLPKVFELFGEEQVRQSALLAIRKGQSYGFRKQRELIRFLDVMYILGFEFDNDPRYPWTRGLLLARGVGPRTRMEMIVRRIRAEKQQLGA